MTTSPALQKIVEAMVSEMQRQAKPPLEYVDRTPAPHLMGAWYYEIEAGIDMEKVARAGLEAINSGEGLMAVLGDRPLGWNAAQTHDLVNRLIDAILGEKP